MCFGRVAKIIRRLVPRHLAGLAAIFRSTPRLHQHGTNQSSGRSGRSPRR
jgi:hypothetical protein